MELAAARFTSHPNTTSKSVLSNIDFTIDNPAEARAFAAAIKQKYSEVLGGSAGSLYCSKYSCFKVSLDDFSMDYGRVGRFRVTPTSYTISILDAVKVDPSDF